jgi:hypothetical protein
MVSYTLCPNLNSQLHPWCRFPSLHMYIEVRYIQMSACYWNCNAYVIRPRSSHVSQLIYEGSLHNEEKSIACPTEWKTVASQVRMIQSRSSVGLICYSQSGLFRRISLYNCPTGTKEQINDWLTCWLNGRVMDEATDRLIYCRSELNKWKSN